MATNFKTIDEKRQLWQNLGSAAESGWDFSSRWFNDSINLSTVETTSILPVDLNSFMCWNFEILSYLYGELGSKNLLKFKKANTIYLDEEEKVSHYQNRYMKFRSSFQKLFYVHNESGWYDYNLKQKRHNFNYYSSMATPLFTRCYYSINLAQSERIFYKMEKMGVFNFAGGIPTRLSIFVDFIIFFSLNNKSKEQWDYPNGWSPLNHMIIEGLRLSQNPM